MAQNAPMKTHQSTENIDSPIFGQIEVKPENIESEALKRILAEVVDGRDENSLVTAGYDRTHNRHNR
jgi:hypothetical protein